MSSRTSLATFWMSRDRFASRLDSVALLYCLLDMTAEKRLRCVIRGDVQGVGFRWSAQERSRDLGLTGFVRNLENGCVEIVAEGPENALAALKTFCTRGPDGARVSDIEVREERATGEFERFEIR